MKTVKIYGEAYEVISEVDEMPVQYWYAKSLHDEPLENKTPTGYCYMEDGSLIGLYSNKKFVKILIIIFAVAAVTLIGINVYNRFFVPQQIGGTMMKVDTLNSDVVAFNAIPQCNGKEIDLRFINGKTAAKVSVSGDGIKTKVVDVEPGAEVVTFPVEVKTKLDTVEATLTVNVNGNTTTYPIIIEIPDNNKSADDGTDLGLTPADHPFAGEGILK